MAEAMIAGLLRGELVAPDQIVASHPRPERRDHLHAEYGIRIAATNGEAIEGADVVLLGIKPQMLAHGSAARSAPTSAAARSSCRVLAGRDDEGADRDARPRPGHPGDAQHAGPARQGRHGLVRDPATTAEQRGQAAALLGALGTQIEVDDEKMVAMATAVSGTGPTYVFLVMEALIDAAVHLGFPRHLAHDLVVETLEGSTLFAKQSRCIRPNCGTW